jgi:NAD-dependent deacetylase
MQGFSTASTTSRDDAPSVLVVTKLDRAHRLLCVFTQKIDGLHSRAGFSQKRLVEIHGTNLLVECQKCHGTSDPEEHFQAFAACRVPPCCRCGGFLKPATISFGQPLRGDELRRAEAAATHCDLVLALGSTLGVYPAAEIPLIGARNGAPYVIVNQGETEHDGRAVVTLRIEGNVSEILPAAVAVALETDDTEHLP